MTPEEQMAFVHAQIGAARRGEVKSLDCPYCGQVTPKGEDFCCKLMLQACVASIERVEITEQLDHIEQVMDRAARN